MSLQELRQDGPASGPAAPSFSVRASSYWAGRYTLRRVASVEDDLGAGPRGQGAAAGASSGPQAMELSTPPPRARGQQQQGGGSGGGASGGAVLDVPSFLLPYVELILRTGEWWWGGWRMVRRGATGAKAPPRAGGHSTTCWGWDRPVTAT